MAVNSSRHNTAVYERGAAASATPPTGRNGLGSLWRERPRWAVLLVAAGLLSLLLYESVRQTEHFQMVDMVVYRDEGNAVRHGHDLYAMLVPRWGLYATYPPFAALLFMPTTFLPVPVLRAVVTCANLALLGTLAGLSFRLVGWPKRQLRPLGVVLAVCTGVWLEPVYTTLRYGQINLFIACLVLADLTKPDHARSKGLLIGIATGLKLTPGVFGIYLLLTGRPRAALVSFAGFAGTALLGWIALPQSSCSFWTRYLYDSNRVGAAWIVDNQSLRGALARLLHEPNPGLPWQLAAATTAGGGLAIAAWAARSSHLLPHADAWGAVCAALTALLISPISWTHHWIWCVPILVLLAAEAAAELEQPRAARHLRWRLLLGVAVLVFAGYGMWLTPHHPVYRSLELTLWQQLPGSVYPAFGLLLLGIALARTVRRHRMAAARRFVLLPEQRSR